MLRAVLDAGIEPDFLVGTSAGALNAAFLGKGFSAESVKDLAGIWSELRTNDVFPGFGWLSSLRALAGSGVLASPSGLARIIERGASATYTCGHVLASAAIPGVFPPVAVDGRTFIDGGVSSHVPLLPARDLGAKTMVVLDTGFP